MYAAWNARTRYASDVTGLSAEISHSTRSDAKWNTSDFTTLLRMQLYVITNSVDAASSLERRIDSLRRFASDWASGGVDYLQIREKDLESGDLERLASALVRELQGSRTKVLVNSRADVALASGADGVHLPAGQSLSPAELRQLFASRGKGESIISTACHSLAEAEMAQKSGANLILFAPVFEKRIPGGQLPGRGLKKLSSVCAAASPLPVFALGGVNKENFRECLAAGATGIAAIRLFQTDDWKQLLP